MKPGRIGLRSEGLLGLTIDTNNFVFEVKFILSLESTLLDGQGAKIELNESHVQCG